MCFYCTKHQENLCEDLLFNNGAYAEFIRIPRRIVENNMLAMPTDISFEDRSHDRAPGLRACAVCTRPVWRSATRSP